MKKPKVLEIFLVSIMQTFGFMENVMLIIFNKQYFFKESNSIES
jgi:hypothetical protein